MPFLGPLDCCLSIKINKQNYWIYILGQKVGSKRPISGISVENKKMKDELFALIICVLRDNAVTVSKGVSALS